MHYLLFFNSLWNLAISEWKFVSTRFLFYFIFLVYLYTHTHNIHAFYVLQRPPEGAALILDEQNSLCISFHGKEIMPSLYDRSGLRCHRLMQLDRRYIWRTQGGRSVSSKRLPQLLLLAQIRPSPAPLIMWASVCTPYILRYCCPLLNSECAVHTQSVSFSWGFPVEWVKQTSHLITQLLNCC